LNPNKRKNITKLIVHKQGQEDWTEYYNYIHDSHDDKVIKKVQKFPPKCRFSSNMLKKEEIKEIEDEQIDSR